MEPFKNIFSAALVASLAGHLGRQMPGFDEAGFVDAVVPRLGSLELMARAQLIADHLHRALPAAAERRAAILLAMLHPDPPDHFDTAADERGVHGWAVLPLTMVVGRHGVDDFDRSMALLREMTKRLTAEFAIRHFLLADQARAIATLHGWVGDPDRHVRRLVSEGTRTRLPWAMRLPALIADPSPILPLLERLRDDPEPYVRRSVANSLNDLSKEHPALVAELAADWLRGADDARRSLLRHACRSLIKRGDAAALALFGHQAPQVQAAPLELSARTIRMGESLELRADLRSVAAGPQSLVVDYVLHLRKASGTLSPKVFKGAVLTLGPGESRTFSRIHRFREVTTRRHYPGRHAVSLRINGVDTEAAEFDLQPAAPA